MSKRCPKIIIKTKKTKVESLELSCFPATLDPLKPGIRILINEYTIWNNRQVRTLEGLSSGPVIMHGVEATEVTWNEMITDDGESIFIHWIDPAEQSDTIVLRMREVSPENTTPYIEDVRVAFPKEIISGKTYTTEDRYFRGTRQAEETYSEKIDSGISVTIDDHSSPCFRITSTSSKNSTRKIETYINEETGLAVIQRLLVKRSEAPNFCIDSRINAPSEPDIAKLPDEDGFVCLMVRIPFYRNRSVDLTSS